MSLPKHFCWTRFGTEAGEGFEHILARKEEERCLNGGVFLWGIGNAIGPSLRRLIQLEPEPEVIFSPIRSAPRKVDVSPEQVVVWTAGRTIDGQPYALPTGSIVTSRYKPGTTRSHYALVCETMANLDVDPKGEMFMFGKLRNLLTNKAVGASQVTAVVQLNAHNENLGGPSYRAAIRVRLAYPYFIELISPIAVPNELPQRFTEQNASDRLSLREFIHTQEQSGIRQNSIQDLPLFA